MKLPVTVDFETFGIEPRPEYPPQPVGVAIKIPGKPARYYAFGHPTENNCTREDAQRALKAVWGGPLLAHSSKFDLEVAYEHFGLPLPPWDRVHDTLFLLFLTNPHAISYALKPSAEQLLGEPPTEQEAVRQWLIEHKIVARNNKQWGAHIADAPGDLVGKYAIGDVERTLALFKLLHPKHRGEAYDRERQLMPILLANEREGLRIDTPRLKREIVRCTNDKRKAEQWILKYLGKPDLNIDSDEELAVALEPHVSHWEYTSTGQKSVAKNNLKPQHFKNPDLASALGYRSRMATCLSTFMLPWAETAAKTADGRIFTNWNQVRGERGGARTGRLSSSSPLNLQNIPKSFEDKNDGYVHPAFLKVKQLPLIRQFVLPDDEASVIAHRDYNQQELRILAHFADGALLDAYKADPRLDIHTFVQQKIEALFGLKMERRAVKICTFAGIYGGGLGKLAELLNMSVDEARQLRDAQRAALPDVAGLDRELKRCGRAGEPITTWGGRVYHCEPPQGDRTFEYKLLNILIQGSAADCTKQALINYDQIKKHGRLMLSVHDEINVSVPQRHAVSEMTRLKEAMESVAFDLPMLTDGKFSSENWGSLVAETAN